MGRVDQLSDKAWILKLLEQNFGSLRKIQMNKNKELSCGNVELQGTK